jgi:hypothetical protein
LNAAQSRLHLCDHPIARIPAYSAHCQFRKVHLLRLAARSFDIFTAWFKLYPYREISPDSLRAAKSRGRAGTMRLYKQSRRGQAISEWALAITLIAAVSLVAFALVSGGVGNIFSTITSSIQQPVSSSGPGGPTPTPSPTPSPSPTPIGSPITAPIADNPVLPAGLAAVDNDALTTIGADVIFAAVDTTMSAPQDNYICGWDAVANVALAAYTDPVADTAGCHKTASGVLLGQFVSVGATAYAAFSSDGGSSWAFAPIGADGSLGVVAAHLPAGFTPYADDSSPSTAALVSNGRLFFVSASNDSPDRVDVAQYTTSGTLIGAYAVPDLFGGSTFNANNGVPIGSLASDGSHVWVVTESDSNIYVFASGNSGTVPGADPDGTIDMSAASPSGEITQLDGLYYAHGSLWVTANNGDQSNLLALGQVYQINPGTSAVLGVTDDMGPAATQTGWSDIGSVGATGDTNTFLIQSNWDTWMATFDATTGEVSASGADNGPLGYDGWGAIYGANRGWLLPSINADSKALSIYGGPYTDLTSGPGNPISPAPSNPPVSVSASPAPQAGGDALVTCSGYAGGATVNITMTSSGSVLKVVLATVTADSSGNVSVSVPIPVGTAAGHYIFGCDGLNSHGVVIGGVSPPTSVGDSGLSASVDPVSGYATESVQVCADGFPANDVLSVSFYGTVLSGSDGSLTVGADGSGCQNVAIPADASEGTHYFELTSGADSSRYADAAFTVGAAPCVPNLVSDTFSRVNTGGVYWTPSGDGSFSLGSEEGPCHLAWTSDPQSGYVAGWIENNQGAIGSPGGDWFDGGYGLSPNMTLPIHGQFTIADSGDTQTQYLTLSFNGGSVVATLNWHSLRYNINNNKFSNWIDFTDNGVTTTADVSLSSGRPTAPYTVEFYTDSVGNNINFRVAGAGYHVTAAEPLTAFNSMFVGGTAGDGTDFRIDDLRITGAADPNVAGYLTNSTVSVADSTLTAGNSTAVTVTIRDINGRLVTNDLPGYPVALNATGGTVSALTSNGDGTYSGTFTATTAGSAIIGAQIGNEAIADTTTVTVSAGAADPAASHWAVDSDRGAWTGVNPLTVMPDGNAYATLILQAYDAGGNPVLTGAPVSFAATPFGDIGPVTAVGDGTYTAHLTSTVAGTVTVTALIGGVPISGSPSVASQVVFPDDLVNTTITASRPSGVTSTVTRGDSALITVQLRDTATDQPVTSSQGVVTLALVPAAPCDLSNVSYYNCPNYYALGIPYGSPPQVTAHDNSDGTYTATFNTVPAYGYGGTGDYTIEGYLGGNLLHHGVVMHVVTSAFSAANSKFSLDTANGQADGSTPVTATASLYDRFNDPLAGSAGSSFAINFSISSGPGSFAGNCTSDCPATNNGDGTWSAPLASAHTGTTVVTASVHDSNANTDTALTNGSPQSVTFASVLSDSSWIVTPAAASTLGSGGHVVADGGYSAYTLTLTALDGSDAPMIDDTNISASILGFTRNWNDRADDWPSTGAFFNGDPTSGYAAPSDVNHDGHYTFTVASNAAGTFTIAAFENNLGVFFPSVTLTFDTATSIPAYGLSNSVYSFSPDNNGAVPADGSTAGAVTLTIMNRAGTATINDPGLDVTFSTDLVGSSCYDSPCSGTYHSDGTWTAPITSTSAGEAGIATRIDGHAIAGPGIYPGGLNFVSVFDQYSYWTDAVGDIYQPATNSWTAADGSTPVAAPTCVANNSTDCSLTMHPYDNSGGDISGYANFGVTGWNGTLNNDNSGTWVQGGHAGYYFTSGTEPGYDWTAEHHNGNGPYTETLRSTTAGVATVDALNELPVEGFLPSVKITFTAP